MSYICIISSQQIHCTDWLPQWGFASMYFCDGQEDWQCVIDFFSYCFFCTVKNCQKISLKMSKDHNSIDVQLYAHHVDCLCYTIHTSGSFIIQLHKCVYVCDIQFLNVNNVEVIKVIDIDLTILCYVPWILSNLMQHV